MTDTYLASLSVHNTVDWLWNIGWLDRKDEKEDMTKP